MDDFKVGDVVVNKANIDGSVLAEHVPLITVESISDGYLYGKDQHRNLVQLLEVDAAFVPTHEAVKPVEFTDVVQTDEQKLAETGVAAEAPSAPVAVVEEPKTEAPTETKSKATK